MPPSRKKIMADCISKLESVTDKVQTELLSLMKNKTLTNQLDYENYNISVEKKRKHLHFLTKHKNFIITRCMQQKGVSVKESWELLKKI